MVLVGLWVVVCSSSWALPPNIAPIADQIEVQGNQIVVPINIGDPDTPIVNLTTWANGDHPFILPSTAFAITGTGATRTLTITPEPGLPGPMEVVVRVSDGTDQAFTSFGLMITATPGTDPLVVPSVPGYYVRSMTDQSVQRNYLLLIPSGYDGLTPTPLMLAYHGGGQSMTNFGHKRPDLGTKCDDEGVILVFPDGTSHNGSKGFVGSPNDPRAVDDIAFTHALLAELQTTLNVDEDRIYGCGFSGGAKFVHWMIENEPCFFAAASAVAGVISDIDFGTGAMTLPPPLEEPVPMLLINGRLDTAKPWNGGVNSEGTPVSSVQQALDYYLDAANCTGLPTTTATPMGLGTISVYDQCDQGAEVVLVDLSTMYHTWPDLADGFDYDANVEIIDFVLSHTRRCLPAVEIRAVGGGQVELTWEGVLQFSADAEAGWGDVMPQPSQPYVLGAGVRGFYRARE